MDGGGAFISKTEAPLLLLHQTFFSSAEKRADQSLIWDFPPTCRVFGHQEAAAVRLSSILEKPKSLSLLCGAATPRTYFHITAKTWIAKRFLTLPCFFFVLFLSFCFFFFVLFVD